MEELSAATHLQLKAQLSQPTRLAEVELHTTLKH